MSCHVLTLRGMVTQYGFIDILDRHKAISANHCLFIFFIIVVDWTPGTYFNDILIDYQTFCKMSSATSPRPQHVDVMSL